MNNFQKIWQAKLRELTAIVDNEGVPIDPDILETVAAFNLNGFPTVKSCAGHTLKHPLVFPFILGWATNKPASRFNHDRKIREKIALKYSGPQEEIELNPAAAKEYYRLVAKHRLQETPEYQAWCQKNKQLRAKIRSLLRQFYARRQASPDAKIYLSPETHGYLVMTGRLKYKQMLRNKTVKPSQIPQIQKKIIAGQLEMKSFTKFLKTKARLLIS